ncbi:NAD-dependent epimerase/dehydratase family protein [Bacillus carboniphilus]|uniref:NAD-dependent epimerase/dehydratase family protein n=1 Tax=Bacillus carboniphilus TaxID=86663 RepID=A0ABY9JUA7_9BACI|nr:NAD-dependent epimerase/dehydratase family protein [Bacillus carboniphilus]WLR42997.1 NAD-dependent epimerase/dehydratase family protein [Bacillus carboniphilus]
MKILVTGSCGFIGSHLCEALLRIPSVYIRGIDAFIGPTSLPLKSVYINNYINHPRFELVVDNLLTYDLSTLLNDIDIVYHLAAIPGVRKSWGKDFDPYVENNILVTQRLLEACKQADVKAFIYASTSSVYGHASNKVSENACLSPLSPYGVTKLTGEYLCHVYQQNHDLPVVILRFFTVYGPRQRPDMFFHRLIKRILLDEPITIYGDGLQTRDFTYIDDCINGTMNVLNQHQQLIGETINIGGLERASVLDTISLLESITNKTVNKEFLPQPIGEPKHTWADISKAEKLLKYKPSTNLYNGLSKQYHYLKKVYWR